MKIEHIIILALLVLTSACNKEEITIKGHFEQSTKKELVVKVKSRTCKKEQILDTIAVSDGSFEFSFEAIKPPVKLTFVTGESSEFDVWVGEYGTELVEVKKDSLYEVNVLGSFFCDELQRMNMNLNKMYIDPIKEKEIEVSKLEELAKLEKLSLEDDIYIDKLKDDIKRAYRLRKKSILKTVRKNTQSPVAVALMCQEYERLTSHQKKECFKYLSRSFADTGLNWQMKH